MEARKARRAIEKQAIYGLRTSCSWGFPVLKKRKFGTRKMDGAAGKFCHPRVITFDVHMFHDWDMDYIWIIYYI